MRIELVIDDLMLLGVDATDRHRLRDGVAQALAERALRIDPGWWRERRWTHLGQHRPPENVDARAPLPTQIAAGIAQALARGPVR